MKKRYAYGTLFAIFLVVVLFNILISILYPYNDLESYFSIRQADSIMETGFPVFYDELSYSGRNYYFQPLFSYILALAGLIISKRLTLLLLPAIFTALIPIIVYLIAKDLTNNDPASLCSAFISAFIPILGSSVNNISPELLSLLLFLGMIYCLLRIHKNSWYVALFLLLSFFSAIASGLITIIIIAFLLYLIMVKVARIKVSQSEYEIIGFATFLTAWIGVLVYQSAFIQHGFNILWQNIPIELISDQRELINIPRHIYQIGVIPVFAGLYILYNNLFEKRSKKTYIFAGVLIVTSTAIVLKMISLQVGLIIIGLCMAILFSIFYQLTAAYIEKTKISRLKKPLLISLWILLALSLCIPYISYAVLKKDHVEAAEMQTFAWIENATQRGSVILASPEEGHLITALGKRKNVADTNYLFMKDANQRYDDIRKIYSTRYETEALKLIGKYDINYIIISARTNAKYDTAPDYLLDTACFALVYDNTTKVYEVLCKLSN